MARTIETSGSGRTIAPNITTVKVYQSRRTNRYDPHLATQSLVATAYSFVNSGRLQPLSSRLGSSFLTSEPR